ncbi:restriction endonuclease subunit S [Hydrogenophaga aromaticivorans]|uniref:restriction endonuclease subunit S n=1 Tax=Hydrogenophaga aromaticivorans TaxID=2610898 RepID=UPI001B37283E|nr:restriction endonuclease subunit S [Hydrogenophaga aromaticivorans]MBQ0917744.1 restriction endonuclease subunit S [Hydrogenophaga aromaticivorans]
MSAVLEANEPSARYLSALQPKLVQHFELLGTAAGGVAKLRELILTLAVQGKLVPQNPNDEPASELLQKIRVEKERLIAQGKLKRDKPLIEIAEVELPFEAPRGWEWVTFGVIAGIERGGSPRPIDSFLTDDPDGLNWIKIGDTDKGGKYITSTREKIRREGLTKTRMVYPGDFLLTNSMSFGRPYITRIEGCIHDGWLRISPPSSLNKDYLFYLLSSQFVRNLFVAAAAGGVVLNLNADKVRNVPIPLPPLAEQSRIVTRVEELMRLCDALEAKGQLEAVQHAQLVQTLLGALTASTSPEELADNWQRVATHFDLLLDRPEAVDALEQTILQLAVRGLLVPQDLTEEPASELLKKIHAEKDRLIADGKIKRAKSLQPVGEDEQPFVVPNGWKWVRIADLCSMVTDGEHLTPTRCYDSTQVPLVTAKNVRHETMDYRVTDYVPLDVADKCWQRCKPEVGDILMVSVGATLGRLCVLREPLDMVLVRSVTVLRPVHLGVLVDFFALHLMSKDSQVEIWSEVKQSAQPCLYLAKSAALKIALPPLAEQSRIVARVKSLRLLCADLRERLKARQATQAYLAEALIDEVA